MVSWLKKFSVLNAVALLSAFIPLISFGGMGLKFKYVSSIYSDGQKVPLKQPEGVACDNKSHLIVSDTGNNRLLRYSFKAGILEPAAVVIKVDQLSYPIKMKVNSKGEILVLDRKQRSIVRLTSAGEFDGYLNVSGLPSPLSYVPRSFDVDVHDNIYILDVFSERVLVLTAEGKYLRQIKFPEEYGFFSDVAVDFKGTVFMVDGVQGMVLAAVKDSPSFSPLAESLKEYVRFPASLTTDSRGRIYLVDRNGGSLIILGQDGSFLGRQSGMGWKEGRLNYPSQICTSNRGEVFIADTNNSRVQIFAMVE